MSASMPLPKARPPVTANRRDIDIWLAYYDEIVDGRQLAGLRLLLSDDEVAQESRFYFADDRKRYLVTRAMVRMVLSRYASIAPENWLFSKNAYGRPVIADAIVEAEVDARGLSFNLSHTRGLIALAVTRGRVLGVDVENIAARCVSLDVAEHFFSPTEVAELACVAADRQQDRFFEYWTLKESYIKARGMGLSLPLDRFSFSFPHHSAVSLSIDHDLQDHADRWSFWQYRPTADYLMAICAERCVDDAPVISMRKFTPLGNEMPVIVPSHRRSETC
jgi:4'-phosphopantetheinyl transferase